uniref:Putative secreted protein n=1 Tax=Amblyomma americanum TaxID=6943 RepID=A0A0C9R6C9_AMBAM
MRVFASIIAFLTVLLLCIAAKDIKKSDSETIRQKPPNIIKFFQRNQRIWRYQQTQSNVITYKEVKPHIKFLQQCIFLEKINMSDTKVYFYEKMDVNGDPVSIQLFGEFDKKAKGVSGSMLVTDQSANDTKPFLRMTLAHAKGGCSIFILTSPEKFPTEGRPQKCEMYVRSRKRANTPPEDCRSFYKEHCKEKAYTTYNSACGAAKYM